MPSEEEVKEALREVLIPGIGRSLTGLNMTRTVEVDSDRLKVTLASTALNSATQEWVQDKARNSLKGLPGVKEIAIEFEQAKPQDLNQIDHIIAVMSGKGGVGKSLVAGLLAVGLNRQSYEVGILDADITGPSIPKMFGITTRPGGSDTGILPVLSRSGIEIMSINLLLPHEDDAVIWRGPLIGKAIQQFWEEVVWGKLDYLLVDLPPGTADAPLTVMQTLPLSGVIIVFSPQDLAAMVVKKAIKMAQKMNVPIFGVVENMSYLLLPDSGKRIEVFGKTKGQEMSMAAGAPLLEQLPLDPELAKLCDDGNIERYDSGVVNNLAQAFLQAVLAKAR
ncbi:MAG: MRP family ATP-binding protein [Dehalococcoidia bacterium]|nr:MAG: MRP family ATP-binding protein [Dehalococcoidia bacterium]